jgi:hypothetical protein
LRISADFFPGCLAIGTVVSAHAFAARPKEGPYDRPEQLARQRGQGLACSDARDPKNPINANQIRLQTSLINQASPESISLALRIAFPTMTSPNFQQMNIRIRRSLLRRAGFRCYGKSVRARRRA